MWTAVKRVWLPTAALIAAAFWFLPVIEAMKFLGGLALIVAAIYAASALPVQVKLAVSRLLPFRRLAVLLLVLGLVFPYFASPFQLRFFSELLILGLLAMSLDVMMGFIGLASFAHAALAGIAAYTAAIILTHLGWSPWAAIGSALVTGTTATAVMGAFSVRVRDIYFGIITVVFGVVTFIVANSWVSVTGGEDGMTIKIPVLAFPGLFEIDAGDFTHFWYLTFAVVLASYLALRRLMRSPIGLVFHGIRENEFRARTIGYGVNAYKIANTAISGFFASLAGVLLLLKNGIIGTEQMDVIHSGEVVIWSVIGGLGTLVGPFLGAGLVFYLSDYLSAFTERYILIIGLVFVVIILLAPKGIMGALHEAWRVAPQREDMTESPETQALRRDIPLATGPRAAAATGLTPQEERIP